MAIRYAFLNESRMCIVDCTYPAEIEPLPDNAIVVDINGGPYINKVFNGGSWSDPASAALPIVVITAISVDEANSARAVIAPDFSNMKLPVGSAVTIDVELKVAGQRVTGFDEAFAMPMRSTDGAMRYINIPFSDGRASFTAEMKDSKRWEVTRDLINSGLPPEAHMDFAGITITAVE